MKKQYKYLLLLAINLILINIAIAQIDQISVGAGYSQQAYYNMSTGEVTMVDNEAWDLAFSTGATDGGILVNESASFSGLPIEVYHIPNSQWEDAIPSDTIFKEEFRLYNDEQSWREGAFNLLKEDENSAFDYGWGAYNPSNHQIAGNKFFVLKMRDEGFKKFEVMSLSSGSYNIRVADLDNTNEETFSVNKSDAGEGADLVYYSFTTKETVTMPTDYDLVFARYTTPLDDGEGGFIEYTVTGVLLGPGVEAAVADEIDPESVLESDYTGDYTPLPKTIGHEWKAYDFTLGWVLPDDRAYFIKTKSGEIYKFVFYDFEGSSTGITTIEKTFIGTTHTINDKIEQNFINVFPNPVGQQLNVELSGSEYVNLSIYDSAGRLILKEKVTNGQFIDLGNEVSNGMYILKAVSGSYTTTKMIAIQR